MRVKQACRELVISWNNVLLTRCCCYFKEDLTKYYTVEHSYSQNWTLGNHFSSSIDNSEELLL